MVEVLYIRISLREGGGFKCCLAQRGALELKRLKTTVSVTKHQTERDPFAALLE